MASLAGLPTEIIFEVVGLLQHCSDLSNLARASQRLHNITNPVLYRRFTNLAVRLGVEQNRFGAIVRALEYAEAKARREFNAEQDLTSNDCHRLLIGPTVKPRHLLYGSLGTWQADWRVEAMDGRLEDARRDLEEDGEYQRPLERGWKTTLLHLACACGHDEMVEFLIDNGAKMDAPSMHLCGCLHMHDGGVEERDPLRLDDRCPKWLPLHTAMCSNHPSTALLLLKRGAPLHVLSDERVGPMVTAMHAAAAHGQLEVVQYLIKRYREDDPTDQGLIGYPDVIGQTYTPMHYLSLCSDYDSALSVANELKAVGMDINEERGGVDNRHADFYEGNNTMNLDDLPIFDTIFASPLALACFMHNYSGARALVRAGGNPSAATVYRSTCLQLVLDLRNLLHLSWEHLRQGENSRTFEKDRADLVRDLITGGVPVELIPLNASRHSQPSSPVMLAARYGLVEEMRLLLEVGKAKPDPPDGGKSRRTALIYAAAICNPACVELLISAGADVQTWVPKSSFICAHYEALLAGWAPWQKALPSQEDRLKVIDLFLKAGADFGMPEFPPVEWPDTAFARELRRIRGGCVTEEQPTGRSGTLADNKIEYSTQSLDYILEHCEPRNFSQNSWVRAMVDTLTGKHGDGLISLPFCQKLADACVRLGYHFRLEDVFSSDWGSKQVMECRHLHDTPDFQEALRIFGVDPGGFAMLANGAENHEDEKEEKGGHE
ncbi:ankyrin repeat-containing domain protein [Cladorrhinum sp. PSN332]|nr:ankyrin repeat-containing domain protein [Cladorrhinum sp. PSN332]